MVFSFSNKRNEDEHLSGYKSKNEFIIRELSTEWTIFSVTGFQETVLFKQIFLLTFLSAQGSASHCNSGRAIRKKRDYGDNEARLVCFLITYIPKDLNLEEFPDHFPTRLSYLNIRCFK